MKIKKFVLLLIICAGIILSAFSVVLAKKLDVVYPDIPGFTAPPTEVKTALPAYIKYIFNFAIWISGFIVFGVLIYAGIRYVTSVGNPVVLSESKNQIFVALVGLALLFGSYLLLSTINPQLVILRGSPIPAGNIIIYKNDKCCEDMECTSGEDYKIINESTPDLGDFSDFRSIKYNARPDELYIKIYSDINYKGSSDTRASVPTCETWGTGGKSIAFQWNIPGIYLCDQNLDAFHRCPGKEMFVPYDTASLGDFNDKAKALILRNKTISIPPVVEGDPWTFSIALVYGAVLHEDADWQGECEIFWNINKPYVSVEGSGGDLKMRYADLTKYFIGERTSSVTVFNTLWPPGVPGGQGVTFYKDRDEGGESVGPIKELDPGDYVKRIPDFRSFEGKNMNDQITSLKIDGNYLVALFEHINYQGKCQVFEASDPNLRDDPMGRCPKFLISVGDALMEDCASSAVIVPTR